MKIKPFVCGLVALGFAIMSACNDDLNRVGGSIQPDDDRIGVYFDSLEIDMSTVAMGPVYAKTVSGLLGEMYDPLYGTLKSDYICQFYCPDNFQFEHTPYEGKIDSVDFIIGYGNDLVGYAAWVGDSLAPMKVDLYKVTKPLDKYYYTDMNPEEYTDMQTSLGSKAYTARDKSVSDSLWYATEVYNSNTGQMMYSYSRHVRIPMPLELGQKLYDETVNNPSSFANQEAFNQYFPGLYVTNTFGTGNLLYVTGSAINIYYRYAEKDINGLDSLVNYGERLTVTKEVIQLNRFNNADVDDLVKPNDDYTYLKTPAGVYTRVVIPSSTIAELMEGRIINDLPLSFTAMPQADWKFSLPVPTRLLLLPEDSVKTFFEENQVDDNVTSYLSTYNSTSRAYNFSNISNALKNQLEKDPEKDLVMVVIPVEANEETNSYYGTKYTVSVSNYLYPSGLTFRKDPEMRQVLVTSSKY